MEPDPAGELPTLPEHAGVRLGLPCAAEVVHPRRHPLLLPRLRRALARHRARPRARVPGGAAFESPLPGPVMLLG